MPRERRPLGEVPEERRPLVEALRTLVDDYKQREQSTETDLAAALLVSRSHLSNYLAGRHLPERADLTHFAQVLGCDEAILAALMPIDAATLRSVSRINLPEPPRFVHRQAKLAELEDRLRDRRFAILLGEAGSGRRTLIRELLAAHPGRYQHVITIDAQSEDGYLAELEEVRLFARMDLDERLDPQSHLETWMARQHRHLVVIVEPFARSALPRQAPTTDLIVVSDTTTQWSHEDPTVVVGPLSRAELRTLLRSDFPDSSDGQLELLETLSDRHAGVVGEILDHARVTTLDTALDASTSSYVRSLGPSAAALAERIERTFADSPQLVEVFVYLSLMSPFSIPTTFFTRKGPHIRTAFDRERVEQIYARLNDARLAQGYESARVLPGTARLGLAITLNQASLLPATQPSLITSRLLLLVLLLHAQLDRYETGPLGPPADLAPDQLVPLTVALLKRAAIFGPHPQGFYNAAFELSSRFLGVVESLGDVRENTGALVAATLGLVDGRVYWPSLPASRAFRFLARGLFAGVFEAEEVADEVRQLLAGAESEIDPDLDYLDLAILARQLDAIDPEAAAGVARLALGLPGVAEDPVTASLLERVRDHRPPGPSYLSDFASNLCADVEEDSARIELLRQALHQASLTTLDRLQLNLDLARLAERQRLYGDARKHLTEALALCGDTLPDFESGVRVHIARLSELAADESPAD